MNKAFTLTISQASALESLHHNKTMSANDFDRHALEQLVTMGLARKQRVGRSATYTITILGEAIYRSL